jgi:hypothetical protein
MLALLFVLLFCCFNQLCGRLLLLLETHTHSLITRQRAMLLYGLHIPEPPKPQRHLVWRVHTPKRALVLTLRVFVVVSMSLQGLHGRSMTSPCSAWECMLYSIVRAALVTAESFRLW